MVESPGHVDGAAASAAVGAGGSGGGYGERIVDLAAGRVLANLEQFRITRDGRRLHDSLCVSPILSEYGAVVGASASARDVSNFLVGGMTKHARRRQRPGDRIALGTADIGFEVE